MMKQNSKKFRITKILLVFFLCSCSIQKDLKYQENITSIIINDYILEFSKINGRKPKAILISDRKEHKKSIQDLPYMASMAYLQNYIQKKENIGAGVFSNVICIYYLDQIGEDKTIFKDVPIKLQKKAEQI